MLQASHGETCDGTAGAVGSGCRTDCTSCGDSVVQASHGETCDPPGSAAGGNGQNCRSDCTVCGDGVIQAADGETCDEGSPTATCNDVCQPAQKVCPFANPAFGPASGCVVLNFGGSVTSTGPAGQFQGNVCIGDSATVGFSGDNFVAGDLNLGPDATCKEHCDSKHVQGNVNHNVDLSTEIQICENARDANTPVSLGGSGPECTESTAKLLQAAEVDFAILGPREACTGDPARRMGDEYTFQRLAGENVQTLNGAGVKKIITTCPHCFNTLGNEYADFGGAYEVVHHTEFLAGLVREGKLSPAASDRTITYHDSCYLARHNDVRSQPRELVDAVGRAVEMPRNRERTFCCGAGGARMWMEEKRGRPINQERVREAAATGAETLAVACPFCTVMLDDGVRETGAKLQVFDLATLLHEAVERKKTDPSGQPHPRPSAGTSP